MPTDNERSESDLAGIDGTQLDPSTRIRQLATRHTAVSLTGAGYLLLDNLKVYKELFARAHRTFTQQSQEEAIPTSTTAEWLLDNYYIVQQALRQIEQDLPKHYYEELPKLEVGAWAGYPRVYDLVRAFIEQMTGHLSANRFQEFVSTYQEWQPLAMGELWALPTMLRIGILETLTHALASELDKKVPTGDPPLAASHGLRVDVLVGNCILSLRAIANQNWKDFFESVSLVEQTLGQDPTNVYQQMDFNTRDRYRKMVEKVARITPYSELEVAQAAIRLACQISPSAEDDGATQRQRHVGYYLIDDGRSTLETELNYSPDLAVRLSRWVVERQPVLFYIGSIGLLTLIVMLVWLIYAANAGATYGLLAITALLTLVPAITLATTIVNWLVPALVPPRLLPKMDFSEAVPPESRTMVVIPGLIADTNDVEFLLQQLELHYLRNSDPQITFAILSDFADAQEKDRPEDADLLRYAEEGVRTMNKRYASNPFYLLHRERLWNPQEDVWMGWERKRGKLEEFNRLICGENNTSFIVTTGDLSILPDIRYVITLDADTLLPHGAAHRLIGTLAHPLNKALFEPNTGRVVAGYTVLQPRTEIKPVSAGRTRFTRIFSGISGLDLYTHAVSDVYQDLFGEGIYVGKGIYDVAAFSRSLEGRVPENALLSHDLFEGIHGRSGLVTDIVLFEDYPPTYLINAHRRHRWIRGDWQLLPWLMPRVPHQDKESIPNPLKFIDLWKIIDNLRRSLMAPTVLALLFVGWLWLPGTPLFWTVMALLTTAGLFLNGLAAHMIRQLKGDDSGDNLINLLRLQIVRWLLFLTFLPYEALVTVDAVITVCVRLFITRKRLLQWTTVVHTVSLFHGKHKLGLIWQEMYAAPVLAFIFVLLIVLWNITVILIALPFLIAWFFSPQVAFWLSHPSENRLEHLEPEQRQQLGRIARRTWLFFEQFMGPVDHWLPPDHYQEHPRGLVAHRTSPTNIGLALLSNLAAFDFGYIGIFELSLRLQNIFQTLQTLERYRGHFLNWYDTRTKKPLPARYVSTVDSGNLAACLLILRQGCLEMPDIHLPRWKRWQGLLDTIDTFGEALVDIESQSPEAVSSVQSKLEQLRQQIQDLGDDPGQWTALLATLAEETWPQIEEEVLNLVEVADLSPAILRRIRIWSERVHHSLFDIRQRRDALMPWLASLNTAPALFLNGDDEAPFSQVWQQLLAVLPQSAQVADIDIICDDARMHLTRLRERLDDASDLTDEVQHARQWCDKLEQELSEAAEIVTNLLDIYTDLSEQSEQMVRDMAFDFLYDPQRRVFRIGYNVDAEEPDANYYDLLASEARITSLIAIAKGEVPQRHWLNLSRPITEVGGQRSLISWSGTMFEYLMPILWTRQYENTLLYESAQAAVKAQIAYALQKNVPWGISESGYYRFDAAMNYQYRAFGIPQLGFKRGLEDDIVISPYASLLALPMSPQAVMKNLQQLCDLDMYGDYGFYEAIDFTKARLSLGQKNARVRSFMVHHQGMILLSLANTLEEEVMVRRFHADPRIQSVELLLQERIPERAPLEEQTSSERETRTRLKREVLVKPWSVAMDTPLPQVHYLSNGRYSVLLTNAGSGYSRWQESDLTRWRADTTCDNWGTWIYVQDRDSGGLWSIGTQPMVGIHSEREVTFAPHKVDLKCRSHDIVTHTEITVPPEDDLEIRRVRLTNQSDETRRLRLVSYGEVVLGQQNADLRHPAFNKMFIESEYIAQTNALLFKRRPRFSDEQSPVMAHMLVVEPDWDWIGTYETDRAHFLGRGGNPRLPKALCADGDGLSGTTGAVLDPIMSLAFEIELGAHSTVNIAFLSLAGDSRSSVLAMIEKYQDWRNIDRAFRQAYTQSEMEMRQLELNAEAVRYSQELLSLLLYPNNTLRAGIDVLAANEQGQSGLWAYAISGDYPILAAKIQAEEDLALARELLQIHTFWRNRGLKIDLVFINEQVGGYTQTLQGQLRRLVHRMDSDLWLDQRGGIFLLQQDKMSTADQILLETAARTVLDAQKGNVAAQLDVFWQQPTRLPDLVPARDSLSRPQIPAVPRPDDLRFDNGWGGFSADGREYVLYLAPGQQTPAPWINVIANPSFGFLVSEVGSSYTWATNSSENRLTPWNNDPVQDRSGETLYLRDEETAEIWSPTPAPVGADTAHLIRHGAGYSVFESNSHGLKQRLRLFVAPKAPVKLVHLRLENTWDHVRWITLTYYAEWVMGTNRDDMQQFLIPEYDSANNALLVRNPYSAEFSDCFTFLAASQEPQGFTTDRAEFLGRLGNVEDPAGLRRIGLASSVKPGLDPCAALQLHVELEPGECKEIHFLLGQGEDRDDALQLVKRFQDEGERRATWEENISHWDRLLDTVTVETPDESFNILLNRWLPYQDLSCRIWGRSAFYQSGGAFGFRDQLQDVIAMLHHAPDIAREHILRAASHQFEAGDVLHWWHPPSGRGVRTRISDDFLWLPYATAHYVWFTGDKTILDEEIPFRQGEPLKEEEEERYGHYALTEQAASLYEHCCRALDKGATAGPHRLPLIGAGDWNDGMNRIGIRGKGESIWLGWFQCAILRDFIPICELMEDKEQADEFRQRMVDLQEALESNAWDENWYLRAFFDNGAPLGSKKNSECKIDSIAQSWAVISGAGDPERSQQAMASVEEELVREDDKIILLFSPPFDKSQKDPGYIKGYPPGIRENGGQYTHAAVWVAWAFAALGDGNRAGALFHMLNPINHSDTQAKAERYGVEPYVTAADIYSEAPFIGRGGWTWYTGSGGWLYRLGLEAILGLQCQGKELRIQPCIPQEWTEYKITYRYKSSSYYIHVANPDGKSCGVVEVILNGEAVPDGVIPLVDDGRQHKVSVRIG